MRTNKLYQSLLLFFFSMYVSNCYATTVNMQIIGASKTKTKFSITFGTPLKSNQTLKITKKDDVILTIKPKGIGVKSFYTDLRHSHKARDKYKYEIIDSKGKVIAIGEKSQILQSNDRDMTIPPVSSKQSKLRVMKARNNTIKAAFNSDMALKGYIKQIVFKIDTLPSGAGTIIVTSTPYFINNPYLKLETDKKIGRASASIQVD